MPNWYPPALVAIAIFWIIVLFFWLFVLPDLRRAKRFGIDELRREIATLLDELMMIKPSISRTEKIAFVVAEINKLKVFKKFDNHAIAAITVRIIEVVEHK